MPTHFGTVAASLEIAALFRRVAAAEIQGCGAPSLLFPEAIRAYIRNQEKEDQRLDQLNLWR